MALEKSFQDQTRQLRRIRDRFVEVLLTIREDCPAELAIADNLGDTFDELRGWLEEALNAAAGGEKNVGHPIDLDGARRALQRCQEQFDKVDERFFSGVASYERLDDLNTMSKHREPEWSERANWADAVLQGIDHCRQEIEESRSALKACWQEIAERVGSTNVSISTTNIGQKIVAAQAEAGNMMEEGVT
jgi:hypothetical protein